MMQSSSSNMPDDDDDVANVDTENFSSLKITNFFFFAVTLVTLHKRRKRKKGDEEVSMHLKLCFVSFIADKVIYFDGEFVGRKFPSKRSKGKGFFQKKKFQVF